MASRWDGSSIGSQEGHIAIITGANSGIGYHAARFLAKKDADVVLAVRSEEKGKAAILQIGQEYPNAKLHLMSLDLADLASIHRFASDYAARFSHLSFLINNAGIMAIPRRLTADGFEMQFGTNHLGHFALTGLLFPLLQKTPASRVVTVSSAAHLRGKIDFGNLDGRAHYRRWQAYSQSKLANLMFALEFQRRLTKAGLDIKSVACHPGLAATHLTAAGLGMGHAWFGKIASLFVNAVAQSSKMGALPTVFAATEPTIHGGEYIGPTGFDKMHGYPGVVRPGAHAENIETAKKLWEISEELTKVKYL